MPHLLTGLLCKAAAGMPPHHYDFLVFPHPARRFRSEEFRKDAAQCFYHVNRFVNGFDQVVMIVQLLSFFEMCPQWTPRRVEVLSCWSCAAWF